MVSHASRAAFHDGESVPALRAGARLRRHRVALGVPRVRRRQGEAPGHGGAGAPDGVGRSSRGGGAQSRPSPSRERRYPAVTCIARAPGSSLVAAGAADGPSGSSISTTEAPTSCSRGHRSEVTALRFNADGSLLVSGGKDTNVVVWDVVAEAGLCRLRGHKDQVTDAVFVPSRGGAPGGGGRATRHVQQGRHRSRVGPRHATLRADGRRARCRVLVPRPRSRRSTTRRRDERRSTPRVRRRRRGRRPSRRGRRRRYRRRFGFRRAAVEGVAAIGRGCESESWERGDGPRDEPRVAAASAPSDGSLIARSDRARASTLRFDADGGLLGVQTVGRAVEMYRPFEPRRRWRSD